MLVSREINLYRKPKVNWNLKRGETYELDMPILNHKQNKLRLSTNLKDRLLLLTCQLVIWQDSTARGKRLVIERLASSCLPIIWTASTSTWLKVTYHYNIFRLKHYQSSLMKYFLSCMLVWNCLLNRSHKYRQSWMNSGSWTRPKLC